VGRKEAIFVATLHDFCTYILLKASVHQAQASNKFTVARAQVQRALNALGRPIVCGDRPLYPFPSSWVAKRRKEYRDKQMEAEEAEEPEAPPPQKEKKAKKKAKKKEPEEEEPGDDEAM